MLSLSLSLSLSHLLYVLLFWPGFLISAIKTWTAHTVGCDPSGVQPTRTHPRPPHSRGLFSGFESTRRRRLPAHVRASSHLHYGDSEVPALFSLLATQEQSATYRLNYIITLSQQLLKTLLIGL